MPKIAYLHEALYAAESAQIHKSANPHLAKLSVSEAIL
jgi:hypothetical protein